MEAVVLLLIIVYFLKLVLESVRLKNNRKKIKVIIHVNGIRGKSTVSRLIDQGLRDGNNKVFTKVTGTEPKYIDVDGKEKRLKRKGKANIREQIKIIDKAVKSGAEILILECMAVKPEFQKICEEKILRANIGVITNVREDHLDEMGNTLDKIANSLSNTIPVNGTLFTGDKKYFKYFKEEGKKKNTEVFLAEDIKEEYGEIDFPENICLALEVCKQLGIDKEKALKRMREYKKDSGVLKEISFKNKLENKIIFVNALAANDPNSTQKIIDLYKEKEVWNTKKYLMINNRKDRISRMEQFIKFALDNEKDFEKIFISGEIKEIFYKKLKRKNLENKIEIINDITNFEKLEEDSLIFAVGNICGIGKKIISDIENKG